MVSLFKKTLSLLGVLAVVALVLNLNIGGRPARDRALEIWNSEAVQKVYQVVSSRVMAVIRKDISVEDAFKPDLNLKDTKETNPSVKSSSSSQAAPKGAENPVAAAKSTEQNKVIHLEKLDEQDKKALEKILEKSSD